MVPSALQHPPLKTPLEFPLAAERGIPRELWQAASGAIVGSCTAHVAIQTFWRFAGEFKYFNTFGQLFESIAHRMAGTTKSKVLDALATNILIIRTLVEIRHFLQRQQVGKKLPRRTQRLLRLLPPATGVAIETWDPSYIMMLFLAINAWGSDDRGAVYALWVPAMLYIGKCVVMRGNGYAGIPARVGEHIRLSM